MPYAEHTVVPVARSRDHLQTLLERHKADRVMLGTEAGRVVIGFQMRSRLLRFEAKLPPPQNEQGCRQRWRALFLVIKAKIEAVESGIETFEEAFLAHIVVPGTGRTMGEYLIPQLEQLTDSKGVPQLPGF